MWRLDLAGTLNNFISNELSIPSPRSPDFMVLWNTTYKSKSP